MARIGITTAFGIAIAATLVSMALFAGVAPERAAAKAHNFAPVKKTHRVVSFRPRGLAASVVRRAKLRYRAHGHWNRKRVPVHRVRRAVRRKTTIRLRSPRRNRGKRAVLRVVAKGHNRGGRGSGKSGDGRPGKPGDRDDPVPEPSDPEPPSDPQPEPPADSDPEPPSDSDPDAPSEPGSTCVTRLTIAEMPGSCWRPYGDGSPFNRRLPANPPLAEGSAAMVKWWAAQPDTNMFKFTGGDADTPNDYDHPVYFSEAGDPLYTVHCRRWTSSCAVDGLRIRIPSAARAAGGTDAHMTVIDQDGGWEYDFWEAEDLPRGGGDLFIGHGGRTRLDGDGLGSNATAAHFGGAAGVIRPEELADGEIAHALFFVVQCTNDSSVPPAGDGHGRTCASMGKSNAGAPAMGQHFYLDMTSREISALRIPTWKKTILRAMAEYGLYVGDTGGGSLKTMSGTSYTSFGMADPWIALGRKLGVPSWNSSSDKKTKYLFDLREDVDWKSKLRVVDPCFAQGTC